MQSESIHQRCAAELLKARSRLPTLKAFVGLDGFVDEIVHVVDKRDTPQSYQRLHSMAAFSQRIAAAAGRSTNIELVCQQTKLGGNGPIMANALAQLGLDVTYLGTLGYPHLHSVFSNFARIAKVHSVADPGQTSALEFIDGKLMLTQSTHFNQIDWPLIQARYGRDPFLGHFESDPLIAFVNWTMIPHMSDLWEALLLEVCPRLSGPRRKLFVDLADPEKRTRQDLLHALELIRRFNAHFDVLLGLNEKEACEVGDALGLATTDHSPEGLCALGRDIQQRVPVSNLVIHPVTFAFAIAQGQVSLVHGPHVPNPLITTGAGDHFNAGYCVAKLLDLDDSLSLLTGVASSGYYVAHAQTPSIEDLARFLSHWPDVPKAPARS